MRLSSLHDIPSPLRYKSQRTKGCRILLTPTNTCQSPPPSPLSLQPLLYSKVLVQLEHCETILIWTACSFHFATPTTHPPSRERWHAQRLHKFTMKHEHISTLHFKIQAFFLPVEQKRIGCPGLFVFNKDEEERGSKWGAVFQEVERSDGNLGMWLKLG